MMLNSEDHRLQLDNLFFKQPSFQDGLFRTSQAALTSEFQDYNSTSLCLTATPICSSSNVIFPNLIEDSFVKAVDKSQSPLYGPGLELFSTSESVSKRHGKFAKTAHIHPLTQKTHTGQDLTDKISQSFRPVSEIPTQFRHIFKEFPYFNSIQSKSLDDLLYTNRNVIVCAPTGSGKTVLFEIAIIRLLMESAAWSNIKVVYMAPIKALCSQRYDDWKQKFGPLGLNCKELTGDTEMDDFFEIQDAQLIMTTPEKWDSMTRKWRDNCLVQLVRLILVDEVHVIKDSARGATLEVVVSRMKTMHLYFSRGPEKSCSNFLLRFVAVSATIPNIKDIAAWLSNEKEPAVCLKMDESHRPVKLRKVVLGFPCINNQTEFKFDLSLNYKVSNVIQTYSDQKPTLVFCATRKGVQQAASVLAKDARFILDTEHKQRLQQHAKSIQDSKLKDLIIHGIGFHHAGVDISDRKIIESVFTSGDLPVLFTTSTLAIGVNLPAHLVIIKSTMHYAGGMFQEYSETDILQMIGRAGRPQFDTSATAVIMTKLQTKEKYMQLISGTDTIESSLHKHLVEHLNAEIALHTISDINVALDWIRSTFLYIRIFQNPIHYGFPQGLDKEGIESKLQELCVTNLNALSSIGMISMDEDFSFKPTETGKLMARYCIAYDTMKQFSSFSGIETLTDLLTVISSAKEFSDIQLRVNEKRILNALNKNKNKTTIRFPIDGKIKSSEMKVNCLIQAQLGCIQIQDFGLTQDTGKIFRNGIRLTKCLSEFLAQDTKNNFNALLNSLILAKCFRAKLWEESPFISKQLDKIGVTLSTAMVNAGLTTFQKIEEIHARELELVLNRHPPFGNQIKDAVRHLPKYEVSLEQIARYSALVAEIVITVNLINHEQLKLKRTAPDSHYVTILIGDTDNRVIFKQKLTDFMLLKSGSWSKKIEVTKTVEGEELSVNLISSEYVGIDIQQKFGVYYCVLKRYGIHRNMVKNGRLETPQCSTEESGNLVCNSDKGNKGISVATKNSKYSDSNLSSYLLDLKSRNEVLPYTPVKRLKMKMSQDVGILDHYEFSQRRKSPVPGMERCESQDEVKMGISSLPQLPKIFRDDVFLHWKPSLSTKEKKPSSGIKSNIDNMHNDYFNTCHKSGIFDVTFELGVDEEEEDWKDDAIANTNKYEVRKKNEQKTPEILGPQQQKDREATLVLEDVDIERFQGRILKNSMAHVTGRPQTMCTNYLKPGAMSFSVEDMDGMSKDCEVVGGHEQSLQATTKPVPRKGEVVIFEDTVINGMKVQVCSIDGESCTVCCLPGAQVGDFPGSANRLLASVGVDPVVIVHIGTNDIHNGSL
ncbi:probable ATP-dependent DNA helicase HFM1 [Erpetoichthys calabaricus]|uniref:probable ATP-dependent DNA helicase HFM1 n=1 Tax=Erpetoichthys calabaricus TaxID=27687 RepID=UPI0022348777|nr:probable ATP-dependent DNA helicase HFM1 [Erpetoichthys calabaricus]